MSVLLLVGLFNLFFGLGAIAFCVRLRLPIYHPAVLYIFYYFVGYVTRPFLILINGRSQLWEFIGFLPDNSELLFSSLCTNVGLVSFVLVPYLLMPSIYGQTHIAPTKVVADRQTGFAWMFLVLVGLGLLAVMAAHGGADDTSVVGYQIDVDDRGGQRLVGTSGYQTAAAEFLPATMLMAVLVVGFRWRALLFLVPFALLRFWMGAGRNAFILLGLTLIWIYLMQRKKRFINLPSMLVGSFILFCFDVVGSDRLAMRNIISGDTTLKLVLQNYFASRGGDAFTSDFQEFDVSTTLFSAIPNLTGYNWFSQYGKIFIWPIPRQLWENKPIYTSIIDLNEIGNYFGLTWSLNADLYSNFGLPSLILGMALLGCLLSYFAWRVTVTSSVFTFSAYWIVLMYLPLLYRDGPSMFIYMVGFALIATYALIRAGHLRLAPYESEVAFPDDSPSAVPSGA